MRGAAFLTCACFSFMVPALAFGSADARIASDRGKSTMAQPENALEWDFGTVKAGEVVRHDFNFKNKSDKPIKIISVATSCGCAVSKANKEMLAPGESTLLEVSFNSKGYNGAVRQFIYVATDAIDKPVVRYIIKAEVEK